MWDILNSNSSLKENWNNINTFELFRKLWFLWQNGMLNLQKIDKTVKQINNTTSVFDLKKLPPVEWYERKYENWKVSLKSKEEDDDILYKKITPWKLKITV